MVSYKDLRFTINNNNLPATPTRFNVPTSLTELAVSLTSRPQNNSVRILGPTTWNFPSITSGFGTSTIYSGICIYISDRQSCLFHYNLQNIFKISHQVKTASFDLGAVVVGDIQSEV